MNTFLVLSALVAIATAQGPTTPDPRAVCDSEGQFAVDSNNMCWYHECVMGQDDNGDFTLAFLPRRCGYMSRVGYNYVQGDSNPCTVNLDASYPSDVANPCDRSQPSIDGPPACHTDAAHPDAVVCLNGGVRMYESNTCWCDCPDTWLGDNDCSKPTFPLDGLPPLSNICVDGEPLADWCTLANGCLNGGTCFNQCDTFYCLCDNPEQNDHYGKRCEIVSP